MATEVNGGRLAAVHPGGPDGGPQSAQMQHLSPWRSGIAGVLRQEEHHRVTSSRKHSGMLYPSAVGRR